MNPLLGIALFVGVYLCVHLYVCAKCRRVVRERLDDLKDTLESMRGRQ